MIKFSEHEYSCDDDFVSEDAVREQNDPNYQGWSLAFWEDGDVVANIIEED